MEIALGALLAIGNAVAVLAGRLLVSIRGGGARLIRHNSILYAEAHGDYVRIVTVEDRHLLRERLEL
jgi:DNA-binding LytR/AlgR family response regulator